MSKSISHILSKSIKKKHHPKEFNRRTFKCITPEMTVLLAKIFKNKYRLPSIILVGKWSGSGVYVEYVRGFNEIDNGVVIPDYDVPNLLKEVVNQTWMMCLVSDDEFLEIDISVKPNRLLKEILNKKGNIWGI